MASQSSARLVVTTIDPGGIRVDVVTPRGRVLAGATCPSTESNHPELLHAVDLLRRRVQHPLAAVVVTTGPGSFSRARLAVVTANALAWGLGVPLYADGRRVGVAVPRYGKPPSISSSGRRVR